MKQFPGVPLCARSTTFVGELTNCSARGLVDVPDDIPRTTDILDLSKNEIQIIESKAFFELANLQILYLQENEIETLEINAFAGLQNLVLLDLSQNKLLYSNKTFYAKVFSPLKSLSELYLHGNVISNYSIYPDRAIAKCKRLKFLKLDSIYAQSLGQGVSKLNRLANLTFSCSRYPNLVGMLYNNTFRYVRHLQNITLSRCKIEFIQSGTFGLLKNLKYLDISDNPSAKYGGLKLLRNLSYGLQSTKTKFLNVSKMIWPHGLSKYLRKYDLEFFRNTSIEEIDISGNNIEMVEAGAMDYLPNTLEVLDISDNRFVYAKYVYDVFKMKNIRIIKANKLNYYHIKDIHVPSEAGAQRNLLGYTIATDYLQRNSHQKSVEATATFQLPPRLEVVESQLSGLNFRIPSFITSNNSLTILNLHKNLIHSWIGPLGLRHLKSLDLSLNYCDHVDSNFFTEMANLETLLVGCNFLGDSLETDVNGDIFKPLNKLKRLDLHRNRIYNLPAKVLTGLSSLEILNVSDNGLEEWNVDISHMVNLTHLDIHSNYLEKLSVEMRNNLSKIADHKDLSVNLFDNNLECNCDNLEFFEWFESSNIHFTDSADYTCLDNTRKWVPIGNVKELIYKLRKKCSSYTVLITICSVVLGLFLVLFIFGIVYRYRWKLRYIYYMTWGRYSLVKVTKDKHYAYDVFVSYAAENETFIKEGMVPNLEERCGLRLCIHDRDFIPGREIAANIVNAIENSKKIVFVMSPAFIESYWCMFEFNMTRMEKIYLRGSEEVMFIIMLENLYTCRLPVEVLDLIQSQSYIEYPDDVQGNVIFWEKMKQAIIA